MGAVHCSQSVKALNTFVNQVRSQLVECIHAGLHGAYTGSQLSFPYKSTCITSVGATGVEMSGPTSHKGGNGDVADANLLTPVPPKPSAILKHGSLGHSKKVL